MEKIIMPTSEKLGTFYLGKLYDLATKKEKHEPLLYNSKDLTTHAVCLGMTGSGKTGLGIALIEEAALNSIPSIIIDPKGDMGNLMLAFPHLSKEEFKPWIDAGEAERKGKSIDAYAEDVAKSWAQGLEASNESPQRVQEFKNAVSMAIYTPGSLAGIPLSILNSFEAPSKEFALDADAMRNRVLSTTSSILGLLGIAADPIKSREHILISTIIDRSWRDGKSIDLAQLIHQVQNPGFDRIGVLDVDTFFPATDRTSLSISLNNLLAAPGFQTWMAGAPLDIENLLYTSEKKPKISILSIAHLNDSERMFFVTLFLNQFIVWMRKQAGTSSLRALFYMDEIFGFFPPIASPPSKMPMITLLKQARAYGLGMVLCTQNPVDLDYKGLSNCGTWFIGRLQTARDKSRVLEGLAAASNGDIDSKEIDNLMGGITTRMFIMRSIYEKEPVLFRTRWTLSYLRGPLTLAQIEILTKNENKDFGVKLTKSLGAQNKALLKPAMANSHIPQYFVRSETSSVSYHPFIAGFSKLHFVDKKTNVDVFVNSCLVAKVEEGKKINWETAASYPDLKQQLISTPAVNAAFTEVPSDMLNEKNVLNYKQDLIAHLFQNQTLKIYECKDLKLISKPEESEADFRQRVQSALKEQNDVQINKIRDVYEKKINLLKDRIRRAEEKKGAEQRQSFFQKIEAFLSFCSTVIGAVFGRKLTKTTINQAETTFRRMGRIGKTSQDVTNAEENLQILQQQLQETKTQYDDEVEKISSKADNTLKFDEVTIRPRKTDIDVDEIALIWWP